MEEEIKLFLYLLPNIVCCFANFSSKRDTKIFPFPFGLARGWKEDWNTETNTIYSMSSWVLHWQIIGFGIEALQIKCWDFVFDLGCGKIDSKVEKLAFEGAKNFHRNKNWFKRIKIALEKQNLFKVEWFFLMGKTIFCVILRKISLWLCLKMKKDLSTSIVSLQAYI